MDELERQQIIDAGRGHLVPYEEPRGNLSRRMERQSRRGFEAALRAIGHDLNSLMAQVRAERRDLKEDAFYEGTEEARALLVGTLEHLAHAVMSLDEARRRLP